MGVKESDDTPESLFVFTSFSESFCAFSVSCDRDVFRRRDEVVAVPPTCKMPFRAQRCPLKQGIEAVSLWPL